MFQNNFKIKFPKKGLKKAFKYLFIVVIFLKVEKTKQ